MSPATSDGSVPTARNATPARVVWLASIVFCGVLPAIALVTLFSVSIYDGSEAIDFRPFYNAAQDILNGENPYPSAEDSLTASEIGRASCRERV